MRRTKIVCTIGPATSSPRALRELADAGMNVARLNLSHGSHEDHGIVIDCIRGLAEERGQPIAILFDLSGPKVRVGKVEGEGVNLVEGAKILLTSRELIGTADEVTLSIPEMIDSVPVGAPLLLDDGTIEIKVTGKKSDALVCTVIHGGILKSKKGVNAPGVSLPIPAITDKDFEDLRFAISKGVDWIAASFVRSAEDMAVVRGFCNAARARIPLIAKIEKFEAVKSIDEIINAVDGIMVARGDLGVEIPIDEVPVVQKMIIKKCNSAGKPVITATQMLDSMIRNPRPTRAEVSDVANAIYDGTDAVMLSGETAVGDYYVQAVQMMDRIASYTEPSISYKHLVNDPFVCRDEGESVTQSIAQATCDIAQQLKAAAIITATSSGRTAVAVSRYRPHTQILAATARTDVLNRLGLVWGVKSFRVPDVATSDEMMEQCLEVVQNTGYVKDGDLVVLTGGVPVGRPGNTNFIKVHRIGQQLFQK